MFFNLNSAAGPPPEFRFNGNPAKRRISHCTQELYTQKAYIIQLQRLIECGSVCGFYCEARLNFAISYNFAKRGNLIFTEMSPGFL
jgi:hypothetical protein